MFATVVPPEKKKSVKKRITLFYACSFVRSFTIFLFIRFVVYPLPCITVRLSVSTSSKFNHSSTRHDPTHEYEYEYHRRSLVVIVIIIITTIIIIIIITTTTLISRRHHQPKHCSCCTACVLGPHTFFFTRKQKQKQKHDV